MRLVMISALVPLCASFASIPKPDPKPYEPPEGQHVIHDHYQFEGVHHPITGLAPNSGGPHKLIVVLAGTVESHNDAFFLRVSALEKAVAAQGHGMVLVEYPDFESYPDFGDAAVAKFEEGNLTGSRGLMCAEWERKGRGVIAGITKLCGRDDFDCSSGIALAGYSQGSGLAVQTSKLLTTPPVNALLTTAWAPLLFAGNAGEEPEAGTGYLLPPDALALHWCGFDDSPTKQPTWSAALPSVPADQYPPALSTFDGTLTRRQPRMHERVFRRRRGADTESPRAASHALKGP